MFVYNASLKLSLRAYGISVPMLDERVDKIWAWLRQKIDSGDLESIRLCEREFAPASYDVLALAHDEDFLKRCESAPQEELFKTYELISENGEFNRYDPRLASRELPELMQSVRRQVSASIYSAELALEHGFAFLLGGGLHHAMTFQGRGFCQFNDIAVAARSLQKTKGAEKIAIIDIDAHKGDGTAQIFANDEKIATFSAHMASGWPLDSDRYDSRGELNPWFIPSDVDVPVESGEEEKYCSKLLEGLESLEKKFGQFDFAIIVAGSDPYEMDSLPSSSPLKLKLDQLLERDRIVYDFFKKRGVPQLYLLSGGYGERAHEPYIQFLESIIKEL